MQIFSIIQVISAILLIVVVLLQHKGASVGGVFGGGGGAVYQTKRGFEKNLFITTIIISIIFLGTSLIAFIF